MKPRKFEPGWALGFGFLGAPLISALNAALLNALFPLASTRSLLLYCDLGFSILILTVPLGFMTMRMLEIWNGGDPNKARSLGVGYGVFAVAFWAWLFQSNGHDWSPYGMPRALGALALPFLWSLLIPLFAIFARAPKK